MNVKPHVCWWGGWETLAARFTTSLLQDSCQRGLALVRSSVVGSTLLARRCVRAVDGKQRRGGPTREMSVRGSKSPQTSVNGVEPL